MLETSLFFFFGGRVWTFFFAVRKLVFYVIFILVEVKLRKLATRVMNSWLQLAPKSLERAYWPENPPLLKKINLFQFFDFITDYESFSNNLIGSHGIYRKKKFFFLAVKTFNTKKTLWKYSKKKSACFYEKSQIYYLINIYIIYIFIKDFDKNWIQFYYDNCIQYYEPLRFYKINMFFCF